MPPRGDPLSFGSQVKATHCHLSVKLADARSRIKTEVIALEVDGLSAEMGVVTTAAISADVRTLAIMHVSSKSVPEVALWHPSSLYLLFRHAFILLYNSRTVRGRLAGGRKRPVSFSVSLLDASFENALTFPDSIVFQNSLLRRKRGPPKLNGRSLPRPDRE
jgi:hypothetical protein